ncbi:MAG: hypothetical protein ACYTXA_28645 [Nostoc sp.]
MLNKKLKDLVRANLVTVLGLSTLALIGNTSAQAASLEITDFTTLNDPDSIDGIASPYGINNHGAIIGNAAYGGFLYQEGYYTTLNAPNAEIGETYPSGINDHGDIVGFYNDANYNTYAFLDQGGNYTILNDPSSMTGGTNPIGINDHGDIVGSYTDPNLITDDGYNYIDGFLYQNGNYTTLNYPNASFLNYPNPVFYYLTGINNHRDIVGYYYNFSSNDIGSLTGIGSFLYKNGNYTALNADPSTGFLATQANAINDEGEIAGFYYDGNGNTHGFIYHDGTYTTVNYPGAISTQLFGINDKGEIIGSYGDANGDGGGFTAEVKEVPEPGTIPATFVFGVGLITARLKLRRKQKASLAA